MGTLRLKAIKCLPIVISLSGYLNNPLASGDARCGMLVRDISNSCGLWHKEKLATRGCKSTLVGTKTQPDTFSYPKGPKSNKPAGHSSRERVKQTGQFLIGVAVKLVIVCNKS